MVGIRATAAWLKLKPNQVLATAVVFDRWPTGLAVFEARLPSWKDLRGTQLLLCV